MSVQIAGPIAYLTGSGSAVYFSVSAASSGTFKASPKGTAAPIRALQNNLNIAYWGEDNRFPQNIEQQMAYCGVGKAALNWKAQALYGAGIVPGEVIDYQDGGKTEIFQPLKRSGNEVIYNTLEDRSLYRFFLEYLQDWTWFSNCFPEAILSKDGKTITGWVHQESCDSRYVQSNDSGIIEKVYLSKLWGAGREQWAQFDPKKTMKGLSTNPSDPSFLDKKYLKGVDCIDMYNAVDSLQEIAARQYESQGLKGLKSAILPVNYPSVNKTYYQVAHWDGARLSGWVEIASKIPSLIKTLYNKAFRIRYHIEVPESYFERKFGYETWHGKDEKQQMAERKNLLQEMDDFLSGDENAYKTFISFFDVDNHDKTEYGRIKISEIKSEGGIDKDLITSSAADMQIVTAMGINPTLPGVGTMGTNKQRSGGSDLREAYLIYGAQLYLERQVALEPLYLMRDYNRLVGGMPEWKASIQFRVRDTVLTTLDTGAGTTKVVS